MKIDIYCFGAVILETIRGMKYSNSTDNDYVTNTVKVKAEEDLLFDIIDEHSGNIQSHKEDVVKMNWIAIPCLQKNLIEFLEGLMSSDPVTDYTLTPFHVKTPEETNGGALSSIKFDSIGT